MLSILNNLLGNYLFYEHTIYDTVKKKYSQDGKKYFNGIVNNNKMDFGENEVFSDSNIGTYSYITKKNSITDFMLI